MSKITTNLELDPITHEEHKRIRVLNQAFIAGMVVPFLYSILFAILKIEGLYIIEFILITTSFFGFFISKQKKLKYGTIIIMVIIPFELLYFPFFVGDIGAEYFIYSFLVIGFYTINNKTKLILGTIYCIVLLILAKYFISLNQFSEKYDIVRKACYYPDIIISVMLIASTSYLFKKDTALFQLTIKEQAQNLKVKVEELKKRETTLTKLLSELSHRVKNNLQFVTGLFTMQVYSSKNPDTIKKLESAKNRLDTIALLYQHLYEKDNPLKPSLRSYINELVQYTIQICGLEEQVESHICIDEIYLNSDTTSHIGLIINELVTNSLKHGFKNKDKILLTISIRKLLGKIIIQVKDNGSGFTVQEKNSDSSFGMKLLNTLSMQYDGQIEFFNINGANAKITLNLNK